MKVFLSYRRADPWAAANVHRLRDVLVEHYDKDDVFLDEDAIPPGVDFAAEIDKAVLQADVLLVLIGDQWTAILEDKRGDKDDFVRLEIESALRAGLLVIPLLIGSSTEMPRKDQLPHEIANFAGINAAPLDTGRDFRIHANRLIDEMERRSETFVQTPAAGEPPILGPQAPRLSPADFRRRAAFLQKARNAFAGLKTKSLYFAGEIPQSKSVAATQAYAPNVTTDAVLVLYDPTVFGGAKFGILMTVDAIYWRYLGGDPESCFYSAIQTIGLTPNNHLLLNGIKDIGLRPWIPKGLMRLLVELRPELRGILTPRAFAFLEK